MDFIKGLPKAGVFNSIIAIVEKLRKFAHFITLRHPFTAKQVAKIFIERVVSKHGIPKLPIADHDKIFLSNFWKELFSTMGTILKKSIAFHPHSDGQAERDNQCLETYLRCVCNEQPTKWNKCIPWAKLQYNTTFHPSSKTTPLQIVFSRLSPPLISYGDREPMNSNVKQLLEDRDSVINALKENLVLAQDRMKKQIDLHRRELKFNVGDEVYFKLEPYCQRSLAQKQSEKLAP